MKKAILKLLVPVAVAGSVLASIGFAQTTQPANPPAQNGGQRDGNGGGHNGRNDGGQNFGGRHGGPNGGPNNVGPNGGMRGAHGGGLLREAATFLGLDPHEIMLMGNGKTLSELTKSLGKDPAALEKVLVAARDKQIDQQVANNRITADQAKTMKANSAAVVKAILNQKIERPANAPAGK